MITLKQAAQELGITPDSLRQRINRGTLKATKMGGVWFITKKTLRDLLENYK